MDNKYSAPYNFIPVNYKVQKNYVEKGQLPKHNNISAELFSGEIQYSVKAETPVFVGGHNGEEFYRDVYGRYAIPGSTLKGLIRTNMQILGFGSIARDIEDYNLMYRKVASMGTKSSRYYRNDILDVKTVSLPKGGQVTIPKNVEAGYIFCKDGKYYIKKSSAKSFDSDTFGKLNYYSVSERIILEDKDNKFSLNTNPFQNKSFDKVSRVENGETKTFWKGIQNPKYYPYYQKVYYIPNGKSVSALIEAENFKVVPEGYKTGYLLSTGMMKNKKVIYIISEMDKDSEASLIPDRDVLAYKYDYEQKKNQLHGTILKDEELKEKARKFFELPKSGDEPRPVFFVYHEGRYFFGYTPYLRIFYSHSVLDGLNDTQKDFISNETGKFSDILTDYPSTILGFSDIIQKDKDSKKITESYKTRVSFEDAIVDSSYKIKENYVVLSSPKMSSYMDYIVQKGKAESTYNDDNFELRGIKQYWFRNQEFQPKITNDSQKTMLKALNKGTEFKGTIHYKNLRKEELGLLLWCLDLGADMQQNIGKAKPYGYGRVSIGINSLKKYDLSKMYNLNSLSLDIYEDITADVANYVKAYKEEIHNKLGLSIELENIPSIKNYLIMKNSKKMPSTDNISYMNVIDYQNRKYALPTPEQVIKGEKGAKIEKVSSKSGNDYNNNMFSKSGGKKEKVIEYIDPGIVKGKDIEVEFIKCDVRRKKISINVKGQIKEIDVNPFKIGNYSSLKKGEKIKVIQDGKNYREKE